MKKLTDEQTQILAAFKEKIVRHPRLHAVLEELQARTLNPAGQPLSAVIGPTGAGKTTLLRQVERGLLETHAERLRTDPGFIPYVSVEARAPERGSFDWKRFYEDILEKANEVHIELKRAFNETVPASIQKESLSGCSTVTLRVAVEHMLRHRGLPPLLIDESQHFLKMASGRRLLDQMDALKSISNMTGVKIVLFGNYDLLALGQLSDQLARRCREIHFGRYRLDDASDVQVFQNIVATFQRGLTTHGSLDLLHHWKYLYRGTLGCVGNLKDWLLEVLAEALRSGRTEIMREDLQRTIRSEASLTKMAKDLRSGEDKWAQREAKSQDLDRLLGFDSGGPDHPASFATGKPSEQGRRVGVRNQVRDAVGLATALS